MTLEELRVATREFREAKALVIAEMEAAAERLELRTNDQMPSWPRYVEADRVWTELLERLIKEA